jgi:hypothetical protein
MRDLKVTYHGVEIEYDERTNRPMCCWNNSRRPMWRRATSGKS